MPIIFDSPATSQLTQFDGAVFCEEDVAGFDISVYFVLTVKIAQATQGIFAYGTNLVFVQRFLVNC